ncbi:class I SAM-dependent methyltransferase [uncultured Roseobacter sp.]|uniref:class I SAM-dependent methyltransferase n=1 Tax=uncultured Roseobacter sp. TaxID=114847 RepID=UPI002636E949|nr:class I SAM-dependent methyltransferase [uncultured Roseobacter sp.]
MIQEPVHGAPPDDRHAFWNQFYASSAGSWQLSLPSQFAAFVANEIDRQAHVVDIGCGNARDSFFFARHGFKVTGLDASEAAVALARKHAEIQGGGDVEFFRTNLQDDQVQRVLSNRRAKAVCVYARFFLHAITEDEEDALIDALHNGCEPGDIVAFEYRTLADQETRKVAAPHFRRYLTSEELDKKMEQRHFLKRYGIEGVGFAKYKSEDAVVARTIYERQE